MVSYIKGFRCIIPLSQAETKDQGEASQVPYWSITEGCLHRPWEKIATDIFLPDESFLFTVDYHSRYFEVASYVAKQEQSS